jgi:hypothetical protein
MLRRKLVVGLFLPQLAECWLLGVLSGKSHMIEVTAHQDNGKLTILRFEGTLNELCDLSRVFEDGAKSGGAILLMNEKAHTELQIAVKGE